MRWQAANLFDAGESCGAEANMAKMLASEASWEAGNAAVNTHGGFGFAVEYDIERKLREITVVVSEQVLSFAMDVADRLFVIEGGRLVHESARVTGVTSSRQSTMLANPSVSVASVQFAVTSEECPALAFASCTNCTALATTLRRNGTSAWVSSTLPTRLGSTHAAGACRSRATS